MPQAQRSVAGAHRDKDDWPKREHALEEARARMARERDLSSTTQTAHYAAASLGQPSYVSIRGVGSVILRKEGWGC